MIKRLVTYIGISFLGGMAYVGITYGLLKAVLTLCHECDPLGIETWLIMVGVAAVILFAVVIVMAGAGDGEE